MSSRGREACFDERVQTAELLALDPDLGETIADPRRRAIAERDLVVRTVSLSEGAWTPDDDPFGARGGLGLLVTRGFLIRRLQLAHRAAGEILGPGDLLRPWQEDVQHVVYPFQPSWLVLDPATIAVIDDRALRRLSRHPEVLSALTGRALERSRRLAGHLVLAQLASVQHRVLLLLWHLADTWGRVRLDGTVLPIPLTHEQLGLLVAARRPSVSTGLSALIDAGLVTTDPHAGWVLLGDPPADLLLLRGAPARP